MQTLVEKDSFRFLWSAIYTLLTLTAVQIIAGEMHCQLMCWEFCLNLKNNILFCFWTNSWMTVRVFNCFTLKMPTNPHMDRRYRHSSLSSVGPSLTWLTLLFGFVIWTTSLWFGPSAVSWHLGQPDVCTSENKSRFALDCAGWTVMVHSLIYILYVISICLPAEFLLLMFHVYGRSSLHGKSADLFNVEHKECVDMSGHIQVRMGATWYC